MILTTLFAFALSAHAIPNSEGEPHLVSFSGEILSQTPYSLKFTPPAGHHFNLGAPTKVELASGGKSVLGLLEKDEHKITAKFESMPKLAKDCAVQAALYVCNDANTYCRPVRQNFDCQTLTVKK